MELDYINSELYKNAFIKLASVVEIRYEREYKKKPFLFPKSIIQHVTNSHRQIYISHPDPSEPTFLTTFLISLLPQKCLKFNMSKTKLIISTSDLLVFQRFPFLTPSFIQGGASLKFRSHPWPLALFHPDFKLITKAYSFNFLNISQISTPQHVHTIIFHLDTIATSKAPCFHSEYPLLSALQRNVFQIKSIFFCLEISEDCHFSLACKALLK